ncbi:MAG: hypothetical protein Q8S00_04675 [Deltaproteobacteria bacterium]|nr:hypothetical protein [Deltaproteobacteria bacterium]MDZ4344837.1 hypothetical protein [Candidatus Binatia bacterium]
MEKMGSVEKMREKIGRKWGENGVRELFSGEKKMGSENFFLDDPGAPIVSSARLPAA